MKRILTIALAVLFGGALIGSPAAAAKGYSKVKGQVVAVEQQVRTANGGEFDRLTIRTRNGEQLHLDLGAGGACQGCYQIGDQVRARVQAGAGNGSGRQVQSMELRRNREAFGYTRQDGKMVRSRGTGRQGGSGGDRARSRDRVQDPGSAACAGCNGARGGSGTRGGGGGGRGGGG